MALRRLFIIVNPTHYLNASEFAYQFPEAENHLIAITPFPDGFKAIDKLGADSFWESRQLIDRRKQSFKSDIPFWSYCDRLLSDWFERIQPQELVLGNLTDRMMYPFLLKKWTSINSCVILDDGTPTLNVLAMRSEQRLYRRLHLASFQEIIKILVAYKVFMPIKLPPANLTFFTLFSDVLTNVDTLINNDFSWTASKVNSALEIPEFYFIGSHISDRNLINQKTYFDSLELIAREANRLNLRFIYVHHRGESTALKGKLKSRFPTIEYDLPLELVFLNRNRPKIFAGHFSSALFNLARIFPDVKTRAYLFPESAIIGSHSEPKEYVLRVQNALRSSDLIESIDMDLTHCNSDNMNGEHSECR